MCSEQDQPEGVDEIMKNFGKMQQDAQYDKLYSSTRRDPSKHAACCNFNYAQLGVTFEASKQALCRCVLIVILGFLLCLLKVLQQNCVSTLRLVLAVDCAGLQAPILQAREGLPAGQSDGQGKFCAMCNHKCDVWSDR